MIPEQVHALAGCTPSPLASYLKALGVLRLICEQADPTARGAWQQDRFRLETALTYDEIDRFFLDRYAPTPIVTPWNGGSGFFAKDSKAGVDFLYGASATRFAPYRATIATARGVLERLGLVKKPDAKIEKPRWLGGCRATFSDIALDWLDAAYVLGESDPRYPPLLGTGGNDGRLEFANNFMQRLAELFTNDGLPTSNSAAWLAASLWGRTVCGLGSSKVGQFQPNAAGGANAAAGFEGDPVVNPWDFVLMIEGALMLGATAVRRFDASGVRGRAAYPFTVGATSTGYGSADTTDETNSRGELWLPLWEQPVGARQLRTLMGEGRADVGSRRARTGLDFARAISSLGVDRGIVAFERYGFHVRNGLSYFATDLGRYQVGQSTRVGLLRELDDWLQRYRGKCSGDTAPGSVRRALRGFEQAAFQLATADTQDGLTQTFLALGQLEAALGASLSFCKKSNVRPLPQLSRAWLDAARVDRPEVRLAESLASVEDRYTGVDLPIRVQVEAVTRRGRAWAFSDDARDVDWHAGQLPEAMAAVLLRRLVAARASGDARFADRGSVFAGLGDIDAFVFGQTDDALLARWFRACLVLERPAERRRAARSARSPIPYAGYGVMKLALAPVTLRGLRVPITPRIVRLALANRGKAALEVAAGRLRASGLPPRAREAHASRQTLQRCTAALLFPISPADTERLAARYLRPTVDPHTDMELA